VDQKFLSHNKSSLKSHELLRTHFSGHLSQIPPDYTGEGKTNLEQEEPVKGQGKKKKDRQQEFDRHSHKKWRFHLAS